MIDYVHLNDDNFSVECRLQKLRAVPPHYHNNHVVIIFVLKGTVSLHAGGLHKKMKEGELAFINSGEIHYTDEEIENEVLVAHIKVSGFYYRNCKAFNETELMELKKSLLTLTYFYYMEELIEEGDYQSACRQIVNIVNDVFAVSENALVQYLNLNSHRNLTAQMAGEKLGISGKKAATLLKKEGLGGFLNYMTYIKCKAADRMILETDMQIKRISGLAGFSSVRSFIKAYKDFSGRTPLQQRKFYKCISKHKFNRVKDYLPFHIIEVTCRHLGILHIKECINKIKSDTPRSEVEVN